MPEPIQNGSNRNVKGQFVPGNTASRGKGRPKGTRSIPDILNRIGDEELGQDSAISKLEAIMRMVYKKAFKGENWAVQFIADRTEGRALERIETNYKEPITIFKFDE